MPQVEARHRFAHSAARVWDLTGDFGGLARWLPGVTGCTVEGEGARDQGGNAVRNVHLADGSVTRESLESWDPSGLRYRYAIVSAKGFAPGTTFVAEFQVVPLADQQCEVIWQATFTLPASLPAEKVASASAKVQQMYQLFLQCLEGHLG